MAATGEGWQAAARCIRGLKEEPQKAEQEKPDQKYLAWYSGYDTGISSKAIWLVMMGMPSDLGGSFGPDVPQDPGDFGRCYRLLELFPEWKPRMAEVAERYPKWRPFVREWGVLTALYETALALGQEKAPEMFDLMQKLVEEGWR